MSELSPDKQQHLDMLTARFAALVSRKYIAGAQEHGGKLWLKKDIIRMAKEEVADLWVYLDTLEQQIIESGVELGSVEE